MPVLPMVTLGRASKSCQVLMPVPFQVWQMRKSSLMLPTQPKSRKLTPTFCGTVSDCVISPGLNALMKVPSVGRGGGGVFHRIEARGARHVLHDDVGIAGDVPADMARQHARVVVVAAAGREADHDAHGLALVEGCDVLRRGGRRVERARAEPQRRQQSHRFLRTHSRDNGNADNLL